MRRKCLPLSSLNHISLLCSSVEKSAQFYEGVLGFVPTKRPGFLNFDGAWLFNYGIGIHLIEAENPDHVLKKSDINPKDNHISFQCDDMKQLESMLEDLGIKYIKRLVEEGGILIEQLFFHDPDGFMIEVCNCDNLPVVPLHSATPCNTRPTTSCVKRTASNMAVKLSETVPECATCM